MKASLFLTGVVFGPASDVRGCRAEWALGHRPARRPLPWPPRRVTRGLRPCSLATALLCCAEETMVWIIRIFLEMQILCWEALFLDTLAVGGGSVVDLIPCILAILLLSTVLEDGSLVAANFFSFLFLWFPGYTVVVKIFLFCRCSAPSSFSSVWGWNPPPSLKSHVWCGGGWFFPLKPKPCSHVSGEAPNPVCLWLELINCLSCLPSSSPLSLPLPLSWVSVSVFTLGMTFLFPPWAPNLACKPVGVH